MGGEKGFKAGLFKKSQHIVLLCKASCEQFGHQSLTFHLPGSEKLPAPAGVVKQCKKCVTEWVVFERVWDISGCLSLIFPLMFFCSFFFIQVLGAKYKHELLVDYPFSNSAGCCGNFHFLLSFCGCSCFFFMTIVSPPFTSWYAVSSKKMSPKWYKSCLSFLTENTLIKKKKKRFQPKIQTFTQHSWIPAILFLFIQYSAHLIYSRSLNVLAQHAGNILRVKCFWVKEILFCLHCDVLYI